MSTPAAHLKKRKNKNKTADSESSRHGAAWIDHKFLVKSTFELKYVHRSNRRHCTNFLIYPSIKPNKNEVNLSKSENE